MPAYRLTNVVEDRTGPDSAARCADGRARERAGTPPRAGLPRRGDGRSLLATVVGEPGVGKSRLAAEVLSAARAEFRVLSGRCLQYGEGITYWPIAEVVRQAVGIRDEHSRDEAHGRLTTLLAEGDASVVAQAIGLAEGTGVDRRDRLRPVRADWRDCSRATALRLRGRHPLGRAGSARSPGRACRAS